MCVLIVSGMPPVCVFVLVLKIMFLKRRRRADGEKELKKDAVRRRRGGKKDKRKSSNLSTSHTTSSFFAHFYSFLHSTFMLHIIITVHFLK